MKLARNSLYSLSGMVVPIAVSLVTIPLLIDAIGAARYGTLAIAWLLLGYFGQADFGIGRAITQRIGSLAGAESAQLAKSVMSAFVIIGLFSVVTTILIYLGAHYFFSGPFEISDPLRAEMLSAVWLLALSTPLVALGGVASGALMGLERFRLVAVAQIFSSSAIQIAPLATAYLIGPELPGLIAAALIGRAVGVIILIFGAWKAFLVGVKARASLAEMRRLAGFGGWIMISAIVSPLMIFADRLIIGAVLGAVAVAAYTIPFQLASRAQMFPIAIVNALFPRFAAEEGRAARQRCQDFSLFTGQIFAPVVIGLIFLADPLLRVWLGDNLDLRSIVIAQIALAGFWLNALANVPYAFIQARGNSRFTALLHIAELPVYFALLYALGSSFGLAGVAWAFTLRCLIDCTALLAKSGAGTRNTLTGLIAPGTLIIASLFASQHITNWPASLGAAILLAALASIASLLQLPNTIMQRLGDIPAIARLLSVRSQLLRNRP